MSAPIIFVLAAALYIHTAGPTLGGGFDSEEFQYVAYTLGIAHSPGYPLYLFLGKLFTSMVPVGNVAYRMNVLSALFGAGTVAFVYLNSIHFTRRPISSLIAAALFATNTAVWRQAGVASVGPLHLLLVAVTVYALLVWYTRQQKQGSRVLPAVAAFTFGLGLGHHSSMVFLAPAIAVLVLLVDADLLRRPRDLARSTFWLVLPLLLYIYIPLRGNEPPWYLNSPEAILKEIFGGNAGEFIRNSPSEIMPAAVAVSEYLSASFGYIGLIFVIIGALSQWPRRFQTSNISINRLDPRLVLFLGMATVLFSVWGVLYAGEPDRYLVLPFVFLIYWFAIGEGILESLIESHIKPLRLRIVTQCALFVILAGLVILPFSDRFHSADWSTFSREYKQWDEIFTLPIPANAVLVGNWGQLNSMRYMQKVENRRSDLQFVGTLYDPAPQTLAAHDLEKGDSTLYLAPGLALPQGSYRYALLGPLLQVRATPEMHLPDYIPITKNVAVSPSLSVIGTGISVALEPYARQSTATLPPGRTARVALFWRAESVMRDWLVRIRLYDPEGRLVAQISEPPVRGLYPPSHWQPGEYVNDVHNFLVPAGLPPGTAQLTIAIVDAETKLQTSNEIALAQLAVDRATDLARDQVFVQHSLDKPLDQRLALWGYGGVDGAHRPGEKMSLYLLWAVRQKIDEDASLYFALSDASGKTWQEWQSSAIAFYPMSRWQPGELLKGYYDLPLLTTLPPGVMTLKVGLSSQPTTPLVKIEIVP